jgi:hypothetical protein
MIILAIRGIPIKSLGFSLFIASTALQPLPGFHARDPAVPVFGKLRCLPGGRPLLARR